MSNSGLPLDATITIVNNSGKLISTGKQLLSIWKTAQTSYQQKRDELSQERAQERAKPPPVPIKRAQTFDTSRSIPHRQYDELSVASSHRTFKSSIAKKQLPPVPNQLALTEGNLEKLSEVSSVAPSKPPSSYQGSYGDAMLVKSGFSRVDPPMALQTVQPRPLVRTRTDTEAEAMKRMSMGSDLHLAYGDIPPDLADRVDLDVHTASPHVDLHDVHVEDEREQAEQLIHKIENLLDEASCAQHSATAIITHLQERPDAAAAVALTLAELSGIITKLSPGFAAILKGTSPAIFALLASPQFLIGTGIAVGVTVVMFGGWKIIQRATQNSFAKKPLAYEAAAAPVPNLPALPESGIDEAIVLESVEVDISSIDTWRRGIVDLGYESADQELMTPAAERVRRSSKAGSEDYFSRKGSKSHRSSSSKTHSSSQSTSSSSHKSHKSRHEKDSSDKKSSSSSGSSKKSDDTSSVGSMALIKKSIASRKKQIDQTGIKSEELPLRTKKQTNMLKALFKSKEHRQTVAT